MRIKIFTTSAQTVNQFYLKIVRSSYSDYDEAVTNDSLRWTLFPVSLTSFDRLIASSPGRQLRLNSADIWQYVYSVCLHEYSSFLV